MRAIVVLAVLLVSCNSNTAPSPATATTVPIASSVPSPTPPATIGAIATASHSAPRATSGRQLGVILLGASETDVIVALGRPTRETISHGLGSPRWEYSDGYVVEFAGVDRRVWQIQIRAPARGATTEGFAIGQSVTELRTSYAGSQVQEFVIEGDRQLQVTMQGELLIATFPPNSGAASLLLRTDPGPP